ncbi:MAG: inositol monophosphatase [bacterium]|nr:inositol monophosphatase [bacterium]
MRATHYNDFETFAIRLARNAGQILLNARGSAKIITKKAHALDFATEADIRSEQYIRSELAKKFPDHGIIGEEGKRVHEESQYTWIIDPLDGTLDYVRGLSLFSVLIALEYTDYLVAGCLYRPTLRELFSASKGSGVRKNRKNVTVSSIASLEKSVIHFKLPRNVVSEEQRERSIKILRSLSKETGLIRESWEDCVSLANIAAGSTEGLIIARTGPAWWDVAPGILMVEEAGGKVTDLHGNAVKNHDLSHGLVASNGKIHDQLLRIINE